MNVNEKNSISRFSYLFFFCTFPYCVTTAEGDEGMETSQREPAVRQKKSGDCLTDRS